ncbi:MAG: nuclear transport factor 2 family protein [Sphingomicrobium sp.]
MKLAFLPLALAISTLAPADTVRAEKLACPAPELATQRDVEQYIIASEEAWAKSVATNDASVVKRILANDFIWVLDGKLLDKKAAVEGAANGPGPFLSNEPDYVHVRIFGDTAVAQGSETWTKKGGRRGKFVWTDTWVKRAGCWQIVNAQDTVVPLAAE